GVDVGDDLILPLLRQDVEQERRRAGPAKLADGTLLTKRAQRVVLDLAYRYQTGVGQLEAAKRRQREIVDAEHVEGKITSRRPIQRTIEGKALRQIAPVEQRTENHARRGSFSLRRQAASANR